MTPRRNRRAGGRVGHTPVEAHPDAHTPAATVSE